MPREKSAGAIIFREEPSSRPRGYPATEGQGNSIKYYLLLHYHSGHWEFPKGHIEGKEKEEETVKREVAEETGIKDLKILPGFKQYIKYFFRSRQSRGSSMAKPSGQYKENIPEKDRKNGKMPWVFKLVAFFVAETKTKEIKISPEHTGFLWLPIDEAIKKTTFKNSKKLLKQADEFLQK